MTAAMATSYCTIFSTELTPRFPPTFLFSGIYATVALFFRTMTDPAAIENRASSSVSNSRSFHVLGLEVAALPA